jgi:hypothetical protein
MKIRVIFQKMMTLRKCDEAQSDSYHQFTYLRTIDEERKVTLTLICIILLNILLANFRSQRHEQVACEKKEENVLILSVLLACLHNFFDICMVFSLTHTFATLVDFLFFSVLLSVLFSV